ncbi:MAG TPA: DUF1501 domain-containing protein [Planctomycetota bacterium]
MMTRRDMLKLLGAGTGSLGLAAVAQDPFAARAAHFRPRAKRLIHLFMNGGPSQVDTFDPKPSLTTYAGQRPAAVNLSTERKTFNLFPSPFPFRKHGKSGLEISSLFPKLAAHADELCVIRSMHTDIPNHEPGLLMMCTGSNLPIRPSMGSWLLYGLGSESRNLPGFLALCPGRPGVVGPQLWSNSFLPGVYQGAHVVNRNMKPGSVIADLSSPLPAPAQREQLDLLQALNGAHAEARPGDNALQARIHSMEMAFRMQAEAQEVFDLNRESAATRAMYGKGDFNDGCLLARRLVERGVRVVQLYYDAKENWDSHESTAHHEGCAKRVDQPIAALLADLKQRGLLEDTLVLWGGEFGRTPTAEGNSTGRDHNHYGFSVWMAGGGVKGGMAYGATDEFGFAAVENRMHVHDLHATILHLMGLDHEKLTFRYSGRDFRLTDVEGKVATAILA